MPKGSSGAIYTTRTIDISRAGTEGTTLPIVNEYRISEVREFVNQAIQSGSPADLRRAQQIAQYNELEWQRWLEYARNSLRRELEKTGRSRSERRIEQLRNRINKYNRGISSLSAETRRINSAIRRAR